MKYTDAIIRILDLLSLSIKLNDKDQKIIGKEIEAHIASLAELDRTGISPQTEEFLIQVVDLYRKYLSSSPGERIVIGDELEKVIDTMMKMQPELKNKD